MATDYVNSTYFYSDAGQTIKANESIIERRSTDSKNLMPLQASLGVGYGEENKWFLSLQGDYKREKALLISDSPWIFRILTEFLPEVGICRITITSEVIFPESYTVTELL